MNPQYDFEDIDDYVQGRMSDPDRRAFELAIAADPQLALQVEALRAEAGMLRHLRREVLLEKLGEWKNEAPVQPKVVSSWYRRWPMAAAAAAIATLLVWALWREYPTKPGDTGIAGQSGLEDSSTNRMTPDMLKEKPQEIATESEEQSTSPSQNQSPVDPLYTALAISNFNADYTGINLMGEPDAQAEQNPLQSAAEAIGRKQYETALAHLRKIPATNPDDYTAAQIMAGDIYFLQRKFERAEKAYAEPAQSKKDKFRDVAQWRLLLAYLAVYPQKSTDFERALRAILKDPDHPYLESAKKVHDQMNKK